MFIVGLAAVLLILVGVAIWAQFAEPKDEDEEVPAAPVTHIEIGKGGVHHVKRGADRRKVQMYVKRDRRRVQRRKKLA